MDVAKGPAGGEDTGMLEVERLNFTYAKADAPALEDVCFNVKRGEIFGFLGPSGAGKSTTQKILIGLLKGFQGRVTVMGKDLNAWKSDYYERIGVSFELPNHFLKLTAVENLRSITCSTSARFTGVRHTRRKRCSSSWASKRMASAVSGNSRRA